MRLSDLRPASYLVASATVDRLRASRFSMGGLPPLAWAEPAVDLVSDAVALGEEFLVASQDDAGFVRAFQLTPGTSTVWMTAHVALVTEDIPSMERFRRRAAEYLIRAGRDDGGFGYNRRVGRDIDSTCQALMVIESVGMEAAGYLHDWVRASQRPDGSFSTYVTDDPALASGWHAPHPDVTQMVAWYFIRRGDEDAYAACAGWLEEVGEPGERPSYWWPGIGYGLWLTGRVGRETVPSMQVVEELERSHALPHQAWALGAGVDSLEATAVEASVRRLLAQQLADGSWVCAPCLRVTSRSVNAASSSAPGRVYSDPYRVLSTAHAIAALNEAALSVRAGSPSMSSPDRAAPQVLDR
jgi:hypothetical protein